MNLDSMLSNLGLSQQTVQDISLLLAIVLVSFVFGMFIGRYKLITVLINIYVAVAIVSAIPGKFLENYVQELVIFLSIVIILTLISKRLFEIYISGSGSGFLWRVFVMSFLEVLFLSSIILSIIPEEKAIGIISKTAYSYLASPLAGLLWMAAPLVFLFVIHKRINR